MNEFTISLIGAIVITTGAWFGMGAVNDYVNNNQVACSEYKEVKKTVFINNVPRIIDSKECVD